MRKRRIRTALPYLLTASLLCSGTAVRPEIVRAADQANSETEQSQNVSIGEDSELIRAESFGLLTEEMAADVQAPVTYRQMCGLLSEKIKEYFGDEKQEEFEAFVGDGMTLDQPMTRDAGMLALFYAADVMVYHANFGENFERTSEMTTVWDELSWEYYGAFPHVGEPIASKIDCISEEGWDNHPVAAFFYMTTVKSQISDQLMLDYDEEACSFHLDQMLTNADAAKAILRLMEVDNPTKEYVPEKNMGQSAEQISDELDAELNQKREERIQEILNTSTEIVKSDTFIPGETYTGTAYYVSNNGDDSNDGLTPETAWKTWTKVNDASAEEGCLQPGDAVFFERGGIWRLNVNDQNEAIRCQTGGITYSAYGEGPKPVLTHSSENGTGSEKWELYSSDETGKKIWKYYRDMRDVGTIYFNEGERTAKRIYECYTENGYVSTNVEFDPNDFVDLVGAVITLEDELRSVEDTLTENLTMISRTYFEESQVNLEIRSGGYPQYTHDGSEQPGELYLRCDDGNPGEIFDSIEFGEMCITGQVWIEQDDVVFDNLAFKYTGNSFIKSGNHENAEDPTRRTVIQNCEFAYGAGTVTAYDTDPETDYLVIQFDGLYNLIDSTTRHNYFHDCDGVAVGFEHGEVEWTEQTPYEYIVTDNVMVNTFSIRLDSSVSDFVKHLKSVIIEDNLVFNTGGADTDYFYSQGALIIADNAYENFVVKDNVFYGTSALSDYTGLMYAIADTTWQNPYETITFDHNIWVQDAGKNIVSEWKKYYLADYMTTDSFREQFHAPTDEVYIKQ